jgi:competence protein ComEC
MTCGERMMAKLEPNDIVLVKGRLLPFNPPTIRGAFDARQYYSLVGIDATGVSFYIQKIGQKEQLFDISSFRCYLTRKILSKVDDEAAGIAAAITTGDKSAIKEEVRQDFIKAGIAHLLAISGLHMNIVAGIVFVTLRKLLACLSLLLGVVSSKRVAAGFTLPVLLSYLAISGFSPSATRAFIMTSIFLTSIILKRSAISLRNVAIAALCVLILDPGALFLVSFQLSFAAVIALVSFYEHYGKRIYLRYAANSFVGKSLFYLRMSVITTIVATIATAPFALATFNRFSFVGILGNMLSIPILSFITVPIGIISLFIGSWAPIFIKIFEVSIKALIKIAQIIAGLPGSDVSLRTPPKYFLWGIVLGGLIFCCFKTKIRKIGLVIISLPILDYFSFDRTPTIVEVSRDVVCLRKGRTLYATSLQKERRKVKEIQKVLGCKGKIEKIKRDEIEKIKDVKRLIIAPSGKKLHPYDF